MFLSTRRSNFADITSPRMTISPSSPTSLPSPPLPSIDSCFRVSLEPIDDATVGIHSNAQLLVDYGLRLRKWIVTMAAEKRPAPQQLSLYLHTDTSMEKKRNLLIKSILSGRPKGVRWRVPAIKKNPKKPKKKQRKTKKNKEKQRKTKKTNIIRYSPLPSMFLSVKLEKKLIKKSWRRPEKVRHVYRFQWSNSAPPSAILQGRSKDPRARSQKKNTEPRTWRQEHGPKNR